MDAGCKMRKVRQCSACGHTGHDKRHCLRAEVDTVKKRRIALEKNSRRLQDVYGNATDPDDIVSDGKTYRPEYGPLFDFYKIEGHIFKIGLLCARIKESRIVGNTKAAMKSIEAAVKEAKKLTAIIRSLESRHGLD